jgi:hypothetical protein
MRTDAGEANPNSTAEGRREVRSSGRGQPVGLSDSRDRRDAEDDLQKQARPRDGI